MTCPVGNPCDCRRLDSKSQVWQGLLLPIKFWHFSMRIGSRLYVTLRYVFDTLESNHPQFLLWFLSLQGKLSHFESIMFRLSSKCINKYSYLSNPSTNIIPWNSWAVKSENFVGPKTALSVDAFSFVHIFWFS